MTVTKGVIGGLVLAGATIAVAEVLPLDRGIVMFSVLLGLIGGVYIGFGAMGTSGMVLVTESVAALAFVALAVMAPFTLNGLALLAIGYVVHGVWDVAHHPGPLTGAPEWYAGSCAAYDWVVGAYILLFFS